MSKIPVSLIIPTHNRKGSLLRTLNSLCLQTYPADRYEVIVVDDGSTDGTEKLMGNSWPFRVRYYRQENAGATAARNAGARNSSAEVLVFMDDDMVASSGMLQHLIRRVSTSERVIVLATLVPAVDGTRNPFSVLCSNGAVFPKDVTQAAPRRGAGSESDGSLIHFTECLTGVLAIRRQDFCALGMFQDPTGGWPNWDDVDFGYRAHLQCFRFWRSYRAFAYHHDYALRSLEASCDRLERISRSAAQLFERYPELAMHLSAYRDKGPISLLADSPGLIARKILRRLASNPIAVAAMKQSSHVLEKHRPTSPLLAPLYRWILSAYIYKGYRQGLRELHETE